MESNSIKPENSQVNEKDNSKTKFNGTLFAIIGGTVAFVAVTVLVTLLIIGDNKFGNTSTTILISDTNNTIKEIEHESLTNNTTEISISTIETSIGNSSSVNTNPNILISTENNLTEPPHSVEDECYELYTAEDLFWFANEVNSGNIFANAILKNNINLNNSNWIPIGQDSTKPYAGNFNGNGYKVSNLNCNITSSEYAGFFGCSEGHISNLTVSGSVTGSVFVGGVIGFNRGTVDSCINMCDVNGYDRVGGVIGLNFGTVTSCTNHGNITSDEDAGGVVGVNDNNVEKCINNGSINGRIWSGGIVGTNTHIVDECKNNGDVQGEGDFTGGIVSCNYKFVKNCTNKGSVNGGIDVGGIVGYNCDRGVVDSCINMGNVSGDSSVGAIVGCNFVTITNCSYYANTSDYGIGECCTHEEVNCTNHGITVLQ